MSFFRRKPYSELSYRCLPKVAIPRTRYLRLNVNQGDFMLFLAVESRHLFPLVILEWVLVLFSHLGVLLYFVQSIGFRFVVNDVDGIS